MNRRNLQIESETEGQPAATRNGPLAAGPKSGIKASQKDLGPGVLGEQRMKSDQATVLRPASGELGMPRLSDANGSEAALRVGVIMGLGYRNLRGDLERLSRYLTGTPIPHHVVREPSDVDAAMREFEAQGLDVVVVSGGDGTVSMVTTWMLTRRSKIPYMAILEGGRTNMTARDVGLRGDQIKRLHRLLNWADEGGRKKHEVLTREALSVSVGSRPTECGFFVGGGAVYQGSLATWNFRDRSRMGFMRTGVGTGASVVKLMTRHLISRSAFAPTRMSMKVDGESVREDRWCVLLASTLKDLAFGMNPFWGDGDGRIGLTAIAEEHRSLIRAGLAGIRGRSTKRNIPDRGYHSFRAEEIVLDLDDGITLDGQIIRPQGAAFHIHVAGKVDFVRV